MMFYIYEIYEEPFLLPLHLICLIVDIMQDIYDLSQFSFLLVYTTDYTLYLTIKLIVCLLFLILIRGGVPRYRYDFLTKIGWVKFLGYVLSVFLFSFSLFFIW